MSTPEGKFESRIEKEDTKEEAPTRHPILQNLDAIADIVRIEGRSFNQTGQETVRFLYKGRYIIHAVINVLDVADRDETKVEISKYDTFSTSPTKQRVELLNLNGKDQLYWQPYTNGVPQTDNYFAGKPENAGQYPILAMTQDVLRTLQTPSTSSNSKAIRVRKPK